MLRRLYVAQYEARQRAAALRCVVSRRLGRTSTGGLGEPRRVLLVIAGLIGDSVMCTPCLIEARRLWPRAHLAILGMRHNRELLEASPMVDSFVETSAYPFSLRGRGEVARVTRLLRGERFDVALVLLGDQFAAMLREAGIPIRVGVRGTTLAPCLTHRYEIGEPRSWGPRERLGALRALGLPARDVAPALLVGDAQRRAAEETLATLGVGRGEPFIALHPFGRIERQRWPIERVIPLAAELRQHAGTRTVLVGGPEEARARAAWAGSADVVDAVGRLRLSELVAVLERASVVVTTDSGPYHIAGALGRPIVGVFRSARPEYASLYPTANVLLGRDAGCAEECIHDRCRTLPCRQLTSIQVAAVAAAAADMLSGAAVASDRDEDTREQR